MRDRDINDVLHEIVAVLVIDELKCVSQCACRHAQKLGRRRKTQAFLHHTDAVLVNCESAARILCRSHNRRYKLWRKAIQYRMDHVHAIWIAHKPHQIGFPRAYRTHQSTSCVRGHRGANKGLDCPRALPVAADVGQARRDLCNQRSALLCAAPCDHFLA